MRSGAHLCEYPAIEAPAFSDEPRFLHRRSEHGYTRAATLAMRSEPEAVDVEVQWLITRQAADRELRTWATSRQRLLGEIEHLRAHTHSPHIERAARAFKREIEALDRKL
jgi:hypothetical protein